MSKWREDAAGFVHVTGVGSSTALAQIVQLVQDAQTRQVPIQSLADTISSVFVPTVCALSLLTYMIWYALCSSGVVPEDWFMKKEPGPFHSCLASLVWSFRVRVPWDWRPRR